MKGAVWRSEVWTYSGSGPGKRERGKMVTNHKDITDHFLQFSGQQFLRVITKLQYTYKLCNHDFSYTFNTMFADCSVFS